VESGDKPSAFCRDGRTILRVTCCPARYPNFQVDSGNFYRLLRPFACYSDAKFIPIFSNPEQGLNVLSGLWSGWMVTASS
jgi:hypothetical protein